MINFSDEAKKLDQEAKSKGYDKEAEAAIKRKVQRRKNIHQSVKPDVY
jgi:hypothetical protein